MLITILLILSLICFIWGAAGSPGVPVNMVALGLAFWVLTVVIGVAR